jgi:hypothetical protein
VTRHVQRRTTGSGWPGPESSWNIHVAILRALGYGARMWGHVITSVGLLLDIFGVIVVTMPLFVSQETAEELSLTRWGWGRAATNPQVRDRLRQSGLAKIGLTLIVLGFALQLAGIWLT